MTSQILYWSVFGQIFLLTLFIYETHTAEFQLVSSCPIGWLKTDLSCELNIPEDLSGTPEDLCKALRAEYKDDEGDKDDEGNKKGKCVKQQIYNFGNIKNVAMFGGGLPPPPPPPPPPSSP